MLRPVQDDETVITVLHMAMAAPAAERAQRIREACSGDTDLFNLVCKYLAWEQSMKGFLTSPLCAALAAEPSFKVGQVLAGRFRILREVARGGMGIVYEATDQKLDRRIALKCAKEGFQKRLPPEVRTASAISHPNICKIYEIHTASTDRGDIDFFTMEFLEGETLSDKLRNSPLQEEETREIALQLCSGLDEAHRNGVIHGDLKSSNIIVTAAANGGTRAVITDFGLALRPDTSKQPPESFGLRGTPDYMAPELWQGHKASVQSDIYALGVVLHEMVYGSTRTPAARGACPNFVPGGKPKWDRILQRCLEHDPERRFQSASELATAIAPPRTRRWWIGAAAAMILALLSVIVTYRAATGPEQSVVLAAMPFDSPGNLSGFAEVLPKQAATRLSRVRGNKRASLSLSPFGHRGGATHLLQGQVRPDGDRVVVRVYLTNVRSKSTAGEWEASYLPGELRYATAAVAGVVTASFHLPALAEDPGVAHAAQQDYRNGLYYLQRNSTIDQAIPLLERAVSTDPHSPLTHAALAEARWWKYRATNDPAWLELTRESVREAERRNPDLAPIYRVSGLLLAAAGRYEQAIAAYTRAIELEPRDHGDAYRRLGNAHAANSDKSLALASYLKAVETDPRNYRNYQVLGHYYDVAADYPQAVAHFRRSVELAPDEPAPHLALGTVLMKHGQFVPAELELRRALELGETPESLNSLGATLMYQGKDQEAIVCFRRALARWPERYLWWMNLGTAYRRLHLVTEARRANLRGLELADAEVRRNPRSGYDRACLAYLSAWTGDIRRAESEIRQALQLTPKDSETLRVAVKTYEALGQRENTLALLRTCPPEVIADLSRYPDLADLHRDSRFKQLMAQ